MNMPQVVANRFRLDEVIGQGSMGEVYRGVDTQTGQAVAIKLLRPDIVAGNPELVERFAREGEALRKLNHPNIVKVLATIEEDYHHYIVLEYVGGGTLRDLLKEQPQLPVRRVLEIALDLADALTRAHHLKIIHRDIKPSNVLLAEDGTPRLTDFGVAHMGDQPRMTQTGSVVGTYAYLSPEACNGEELDTRTDIWSFGAMLYEMLAGQRPFEGIQPTAILISILTRPVPPVTQLRPDVPDALASLVSQMLEKDRERRIPSVRRVGAELEAMMSSLSGPVLQVQVPMRSTGRLSVNVIAESESLRFATPTPSTSSGRLFNLPSHSTPFIGREAELAEIAERLKDASCRLLTLVGPGGVGKSRLATQAAADVIDAYPQGVIFAPLAELRSPDLLVATLADSLKCPISGAADPKAQLLDFLAEKEMLLIVDGFEHLIEGAGLLTDILEAAPGMKMLVTSRERLNLQEEWTLEIEGLAFPDDEASEHPERYSAVQLFLQNARRVHAGFVVPDEEQPSLIRICRLMEGTPLGIELASSWARMLSCSEICKEIEQNRDFLETSMRNVPERHRSLRAVFEHSWRLLSEGERKAYQKLSVFRGGFDRDAAQKVAGASLALLSALVDKSLLRRMPSGRYALPGVVRQYAEEKLDEDPQEKEGVQDRHGAYYAGLLSQWEKHLEGARQKEALEKIGSEIENVREGWNRAVEGARLAEIGKYLESLYRFYEIRSWIHEGQEALGKAIARLGGPDGALAGDRPKAEILGKALARQAVFCHRLSRYGEAGQLLLRSLAIFRQYDLREEAAAALTHLGNISEKLGELAEARQLHQQSFDAFKEIDDRAGMALALNNLGDVARVQGEYAEAKRFYEDGLMLCTDIGDRRGMASAINNLGDVAQQVGELADAQRLYEDSLATCKEIGDQRGIARAFNNLGAIAFLRREFAEAGQYYQKSLTVFKAIGDQNGIAYCLANSGRFALAMEDHRQAMDNFREALKIAMSLRAIPLALDVLTGVAAQLTEGGEPTGQLRAVEMLSLVIHHPASEKQTRDGAVRLLDDLKTELASDVLEAAQERGKANSLDVIAKEAMGDKRATR